MCAHRASQTRRSRTTSSHRELHAADGTARRSNRTARTLRTQLHTTAVKPQTHAKHFMPPTSQPSPSTHCSQRTRSGQHGDSCRRTRTRFVGHANGSAVAARTEQAGAHHADGEKQRGLPRQAPSFLWTLLPPLLSLVITSPFPLATALGRGCSHLFARQWPHGHGRVGKGADRH